MFFFVGGGHLLAGRQTREAAVGRRALNFYPLHLRFGVIWVSLCRFFFTVRKGRWGINLLKPMWKYCVDLEEIKESSMTSVPRQPLKLARNQHRHWKCQDNPIGVQESSSAWKGLTAVQFLIKILHLLTSYHFLKISIRRDRIRRSVVHYQITNR